MPFRHSSVNHDDGRRPHVAADDTRDGAPLGGGAVPNPLLHRLTRRRTQPTSRSRRLGVCPARLCRLRPRGQPVVQPSRLGHARARHVGRCRLVTQASFLLAIVAVERPHHAGAMTALVRRDHALRASGLEHRGQQAQRQGATECRPRPGTGLAPLSQRLCDRPDSIDTSASVGTVTAMAFHQLQSGRSSPWKWCSAA